MGYRSFSAPRSSCRTRAAMDASISRTLRNKFVAGLVVLVPIVITVQALRWLFTFLDGLAQPLAYYVVGTPVPGIGFLPTVLIVFFAGLLLAEGPGAKLPGL